MISELSGKLKVPSYRQNGRFPSYRSFIRLVPSLSCRLPGRPTTSETICRLSRLLYSPRQPASQSTCSEPCVRAQRHATAANRTAVLCCCGNCRINNSTDVSTQSVNCQHNSGCRHACRSYASIAGPPRWTACIAMATTAAS